MSQPDEHAAEGGLGAGTNDASEHFQLHLLLCVARVLAAFAREHGLETALARYHFLADYLKQVTSALPGTSIEVGARELERRLLERERTATARLPLRALAGALELDFEERLAIIAAGLPEVDDAFGAMFANMQGQPARRRPTLGTLRYLISLEPDDNRLDWAERLLSSGILEGLDADAPRAELPVRVNPLLWPVLRGRELQGDDCEASLGAQGATDEEPALLPRVSERIDKAVALTQREKLAKLVLRGGPGTEPERWARLFARRVSRRLIEVHLSEPFERTSWDRLGSLCVAVEAVMFVASGAHLSAERRPPRGYRGPLIVADAEARHETQPGAVVVDIPELAVDDRRRLWKACLPEASLESVEKLALLHVLPSGHVRAAASRTLLELGEPKPTERVIEEVRRSLRDMAREGFGELAQWVDDSSGWDDLIVDAAVEQELRLLELRCAHREALSLGSRGKSGVGVHALFAGASGTGKTLAASVLANALGKDLFRLDLASVLSKYVGDTEKHLSRALRLAQALDCVIVLDEGDTWLARRSGGSGSNERFANMETGFLLQALEAHRGVVVVTSNLPRNIDPAFLRRLEIVRFAVPDAGQRERIWRLHLREHDLSPRDLRDVANRETLTGGQIRNAARRAHLLALRDRARIGSEHLALAVADQRRKAGQAPTPAAPTETSLHGVTLFANRLRGRAPRADTGGRGS